MAEMLQKWEGNHRHIWPCDCGAHHYVELEWDDGDPDFRYLSLVDYYHVKTLRPRLKDAWKALRGRKHGYSEVVLTDQTLTEILTVLSKHAGET